MPLLDSQSRGQSGIDATRFNGEEEIVGNIWDSTSFPLLPGKFDDRYFFYCREECGVGGLDSAV
jgi:hypothetical protein